MAAAYGIYHGPDGIKHIAERANTFANMFASETSPKYKLVADTFFDTVCLDTGADTADILKRAYNYGINLRKVNDERISVSFDETTELKDINNLLEIFGVEKKLEALDANTATSIPAELVRASKFMEHEVFNSFHSETEMLRYLKRLENKDIALNQSMIALGSCTMKLNAVAEMIPVTWPEFGGLHPFAPVDQAQGYQELFEDLKKMLSEITGFSGISLQPNAGAQGEYAGLMTIRKFHISNGDEERSICIIPESAHGTNPASAQMAGMKVVVIDCCWIWKY